MPEFNTTEVAPVELPRVMVLALAFVPISIAPVVPESRVRAFVVFEFTVKVPSEFIVLPAAKVRAAVGAVVPMPTLAPVNSK